MRLKTSETNSSVAGGIGAVVALLRGLIDYAGLFPPASLAMSPAVANYESYLNSKYHWILGRFIVPVAPLREFENAVKELSANLSPASLETESRRTISVLLGADAPADIERIRQFNDHMAVSSYLPKAEIKSIEVKVSSPEEIERLSALIPRKLETYFEIPPPSSHSVLATQDCVVAVAHCGRCAKIRTGGETADKFPAPESVIEFVRLCAASGVPFKATAGLHHPIRSLHRFTYQPDSPSGVMHGFLNVFLAAAFLRAGMEPSTALQLLNEQSAVAFHFDSDAAIWREHRLNVREITAARERFCLSFGSCSFTEPIDDLRTLHLL